MNIIKRIFCGLFGHKKSRSVGPTLTVFVAVNPEKTPMEEAERLVAEQAEKLAFLKPQTAIMAYHDEAEYRKIFKELLADTITTDFVLVLNPKANTINKEDWSDEFFSYDFVGKPLKKENWIKKIFQFRGQDPENDNLYVGKGCPSIRSRQLCVAVKDHYVKSPDDYYEDTALCVHFRDYFELRGFKFAPVEVSLKLK